MYIYKVLLGVMLLLAPASLWGQTGNALPVRTPEQEAAAQTEKLARVLDLSEEQVKKVYAINLRYARQRHISNSRAEAMERVKHKNADLRRVLTPEQYERLQNKRYERSSFRPRPDAADTADHRPSVPAKTQPGRRPAADEAPPAEE